MLFSLLCRNFRCVYFRLFETQVHSFLSQKNPSIPKDDEDPFLTASRLSLAYKILIFVNIFSQGLLAPYLSRYLLIGRYRFFITLFVLLAFWPTFGCGIMFYTLRFLLPLWVILLRFLPSLWDPGSLRSFLEKTLPSWNMTYTLQEMFSQGLLSMEFI